MVNESIFHHEIYEIFKKQYPQQACNSQESKLNQEIDIRYD